MSREELIKIFQNAYDNKTDVYVAITIPGQKDVEYIVNKHRSLKNKLEYYCTMYDSNSVHTKNKDIKIVDAGCIDFYMGE